jgi:hypothetical protein
MIEAWSDEKIKAALPRCLSIMQIKRKGILARDVDDLLAADRAYYVGKTVKKALRIRLSSLIPKVLEYHDDGRTR